MKIADILPRSMIVASLTSRSKGDVIAELARHIADVEGVSYGSVLRVLEERERLGPTGIGEGVAIPHGTLSELTHLVAMFGRSLEGIDFDAIDGKVTHLFFVLLTPDNNVGLQALARVSRLMRSESFRASLLGLPGQDALYQAIIAEDERI